MCNNFVILCINNIVRRTGVTEHLKGTIKLFIAIKTHYYRVTDSKINSQLLTFRDVDKEI